MSNKEKKFRVLTTGGGTAGHIHPIVAVVAELQALAAQKGVPLEVRYMGAYGPFKNLLRENAIRTQRIASSKLRRYFSLMNIVDAFKLGWGLLQALWKVYWYMPDVVFSKGGPGVVPVVLIARFYQIPVVVHDSDALPGLSSTITAKFASLVATSFDSAAEYFQGKEIINTGNPVRSYLLAEPLTQTKAKGFFGFKTNEPLVLFLGGSQGATRMNDFVLDALPELVKETQVFHVTGRQSYDSVVAEYNVVSRDLPPGSRDKYKAIDFMEKDIRIALQAADVVVSRSGAGGIFEIAAFGKPSILVPIPQAYTPSQEANAAEYAESGAALVMEQDNLLPNLFLTNLKGLLGSKVKLEKMSRAASAFYKPDAASNLAQIILRYR